MLQVDSMLHFETLAILIAVFLFSWGVSALVIFFRAPLLAFMRRGEDLDAVQCAHEEPTPRLGGVGIILAIMLGFCVLFDGEWLFKGALLLSLMPVMVAGFLEDIGISVSPRRRLLAALVSGIMFLCLNGSWIEGVGLYWFDVLFALPPMAIVITLIWSTGMSHAFNLIDGVNGFAGATAIMVAAGLGLIAGFAGDHNMALLASVYIVAVAGFQLHNWPNGGLFLGDCGAYSLGHLLVWLGIVIVSRNPEVVGISVALLYFWPVLDTLWAIYRRKRTGRDAAQPDRMHFHQLVMRTLEIRFGLRGRRNIANSLTSTILTPVVAGPIAVGVLFYNNAVVGFVAMVLMTLLFILFYVGLLSYAKSTIRKDSWKPVSETHEEPVQLAEGLAERIPAE